MNDVIERGLNITRTLSKHGDLISSLERRMKEMDNKIEKMEEKMKKLGE